MRIAFRSLLSGLAVALGLSIVSAQEAEAQGLVEACYIEKTGAIYLINVEGAPTECIKPDKHFLISWTDGAGAIRSGDAASGDLGGTFPAPTVTALNGTPLSGTPAEGQVLTFDAASSSWMPASPPSLAGQSCSAGEVVVGVQANGTLHCQRPATCVGSEPVPHFMQVVFTQGSMFGVTAPAAVSARFEVPCSALQSDGFKGAGAVSNFVVQVGGKVFDQSVLNGIQNVRVLNGKVVGLAANFFEGGNDLFQMAVDGTVVAGNAFSGTNLQAPSGGQRFGQFNR